MGNILFFDCFEVPVNFFEKPVLSTVEMIFSDTPCVGQIKDFLIQFEANF